MKIRISDIGPAGLKVNDNIPLEPLNKRMNEAKSNDILFTQKPEVEVLVHKTPNGAQVKGNAKVKYTQPCSLCIKELERELDVPINYIFQRRTPIELSKSKDGEDNYLDDIGICYFSGEHIELEELVQESLILSLDHFYKPERNEKNECKICGKNCSTSYTL
jgi:uncharacterized metal-binding protein YceD (DUF177 family)